jgi:hypothetical protein
VTRLLSQVVLAVLRVCTHGIPIHERGFDVRVYRRHADEGAIGAPYPAIGSRGRSGFNVKRRLSQ